jgi:hypothetical protein
MELKWKKVKHQTDWWEMMGQQINENAASLAGPQVASKRSSGEISSSDAKRFKKRRPNNWRGVFVENEGVKRSKNKDSAREIMKERAAPPRVMNMREKNEMLMAEEGMGEIFDNEEYSEEYSSGLELDDSDDDVDPRDLFPIPRHELVLMRHR